MEETKTKEKLVEDSKDLKEKLRLSRKVRFLIFVIFWFIQLFNCSDGGVVSSSSVHVKKDLNLNNTWFGTYGSIVQVGRTTGTFIVMILLNTLNRKYLMVFAIFLKCSSFLIYLVTMNWWVVITFRFLQGVAHVFPYVYFPTWCDQFGIQKYKAIMMSGIQTASPFGSVFGFSVTTYIGSWVWGFATLAFLIIPLNLILLCIPDSYFSGKVYFFKQVGSDDKNSQKDEGKKSIYSLFERTSNIVHKGGKDGKKPSGASVWLSLFDKVFLFISLARTVVMFIFMAIHYWLGDYFTTVLLIQDKNVKTSTYSVVSLVGPFAGSLLGGTVCQYFAGGYDKKNAIYVCLFFSFLTGISGTIIPEFTNFYIFAVALFCFFFFANGMMPILIGISFNCVPKTLRGSAYSINTLLCTCLGNFPSPIIYGKINDIYKDTDRRMAMRCVTNYIWVNFILLILTGIFMKRNDNENKEGEQRPSKVSDVGAGMEGSTGQNPISELATTQQPKAEEEEEEEEELKNIDNKA